MSRVALVTGSSRGIGRAVAIRLAKDGYDICVNYEKRADKAEETAAAVRELGRKAITFKADVSDSDAVNAMFDFAGKELGEVDVLVSNAGIAGQAQIQDVTRERWDRFFAVNVTGAFNAVHEVIPHMIHEKKGCIITISSMWGLRGASCESVYSATKAALIGFTRSLAKELAPSGIRVNCVAPGVIDTDMLDELPEGVKDTLADETPLGRLGTPEDIAEAVAFLASDKADFITGQVIMPDGGFVV